MATRRTSFSDNFNRSNRLLHNDNGWVRTGTTPMAIRDNTATVDGSLTLGRSGQYIDTLGPTNWAEAKIDLMTVFNEEATPMYLGCAGRTTSRHVCVRINRAGMALGELNGDDFTEFLTNTRVLVDDDVLRIEYRTTNDDTSAFDIKVFVNDAEVTDLAIDFPFGSGENTGRFLLGAGADIFGAAGSWDDFSCGDWADAPSVDNVNGSTNTAYSTGAFAVNGTQLDQVTAVRMSLADARPMDLEINNQEASVLDLVPVDIHTTTFPPGTLRLHLDYDEGEGGTVTHDFTFNVEADSHVVTAADIDTTLGLGQATGSANGDRFEIKQRIAGNQTTLLATTNFEVHPAVPNSTSSTYWRYQGTAWDSGTFTINQAGALRGRWSGPFTLPQATAGQDYSFDTSNYAEGDAPLTFSLAAGTLPSTMTYTAAGLLVGYVEQDGLISGLSFRVQNPSGGSNTTPMSLTTIAPFIRNPEHGSVTDNSAMISITTDSPRKAIAWVVDQFPGAPTAAAILYGRNSIGEFAESFGNYDISDAGAQPPVATPGLIAGSQYYYHFTQYVGTVPEGAYVDFLDTAEPGVFARNSWSYQTDNLGRSTNRLPPNVPAMEGARYIRNYLLADNSVELTGWNMISGAVLLSPNTAALPNIYAGFHLTNVPLEESESGRQFTFRCTATGDGDVEIRVRNKDNQEGSHTRVSLTGDPQSFSVTHAFSVGQTTSEVSVWIRTQTNSPPAATFITITAMQLEDTTTAAEVPSEWILGGTVDYSINELETTVDDDGVVTDAVGDPITTMRGLRLGREVVDVPDSRPTRFDLALSSIGATPFVNNRCGQVIVQMDQASTVQTNNRLWTFDADPTSPNGELALIENGGRFTLRKGVSNTVNQDAQITGVTYAADDVLDIRWRISSTTGMKVWVYKNGAKQDDAETASATANAGVSLAVYRGEGAHKYTLRTVRVMPTVESDAEIEAWVAFATGPVSVSNVESSEFATTGSPPQDAQWRQQIVLPVSPPGVAYPTMDLSTSATGEPPLTFAGGNLPSAMAVSSAGILSGIPAAAFEGPVSLSVSNDFNEDIQTPNLRIADITLTDPRTQGVTMTEVQVRVATDSTLGSASWAITTSATPPSPEDIANGTGAVRSGSNPVLATGVQPWRQVTTLVAATDYWVHWTQGTLGTYLTPLVVTAAFRTLAPAANPPRWIYKDAIAYTGPVGIAINEDISVNTTGGAITSNAIVEGGLPPGVLYDDGKVEGTPTASGAFPVTFRIQNADGFDDWVTRVDITDILLSDATTRSVEQDRAQIRVSTNSTIADIFYVVTTLTGTPTATQIAAGQGPDGTAATRAGNFQATATGPQPWIMITGLTETTRYYTHFTQGVSGTYLSNVASTNFITIGTAPSWDEFTLPGGIKDAAYSYDTAQHANGTAPLSFVSNSQLPTGMTYSSAGLLSGTPSNEFNRSVNLEVRNQWGTARINVQLIIEEAAIAPILVQNYQDLFIRNGVPVSIDLTTPYWASNAGAMTFALSGTLPTGLTFTPGTGLLTGTANTDGATGPHAITATNTEGSTVGNSFAVHVVTVVAAEGSRSDLKRDALINQGYTGNMSDMTLGWLKANGATSDSVPDAWMEMLASRGQENGARNDRWYALLGARGYQGAIADREILFWNDGGTFGTPLPVTPDNTSGIRRLIQAEYGGTPATDIELNDGDAEGQHTYITFGITRHATSYADGVLSNGFRAGLEVRADWGAPQNVFSWGGHEFGSAAWGDFVAGRRMDVAIRLTRNGAGAAVFDSVTMNGVEVTGSGVLGPQNTIVVMIGGWVFSNEVSPGIMHYMRIQTMGGKFFDWRMDEGSGNVCSSSEDANDLTYSGTEGTDWEWTT